MLEHFDLIVPLLLLMLKMFDGTVVENNCLDVCVQLCDTFAANFVLVQVQLNRTNSHWDSNQAPLGSNEGDSPDSGEKSVFELEFSPINKRDSDCHC